MNNKIDYLKTLNALTDIQMHIENLIAATPTSDTRNSLTDLNILTLKLMEEIMKKKKEQAENV